MSGATSAFIIAYYWGRLVEKSWALPLLAPLKNTYIKEDNFIFKLVNVNKTYDKKINVLKNINLSFPIKGFVSILGKSGSGKSTLLNLLIGIDKPTLGNVYFNGTDINKLKDCYKKRYQNIEIGILFQHFNLFDNLTCLENVIIPCLISGINKIEAIKKANLLFKKYKLEHLSNQLFSTLSGGEKQRIALIRALINNPKVIIADEPTGALDSINSELIIKELKELSKDHLVIVVTHNESLIKKYEDYRININEGETTCLAVSDVPKLNIKTKSNKTNIFLIKSFLFSHLKKHKVRNILSSLAISFSTLCLFLAFGYINGSNKSVNEYSHKSMQYGVATIAKKDVVDIPGSPIKISKLSRPEISEIYFINEKIKSAEIVNNYQSLFPICPTFQFDNKSIDDIEFSPVYDFKNYSSLLKEGTFPNNDEFLEVVVNEEFINRFSYNDKEILNTEIKLACDVEITNPTISNKNIKDKITYSNKLIIKGVVKEFAYLNTPRVYYSYLGLDDYLDSIILENYSKELGFEISGKEVVSFADNKNSNSGLSYNLFVNDLNEVNKLFDLKSKFDSNNQFDIVSNCYSIINSYSSMTNIISKSLIIFIVIAILGAIFIVSIATYSNYTINKKESAILSTLGLQRNKLFNIFAIENVLLSLLSVIASLIISKPIEILLNYILYNSFKLENLVAVPFLSFVPILVIFLAMLIGFLSTFIPFIFYEKNYIVEELKDE